MNINTSIHLVSGVSSKTCYITTLVGKEINVLIMIMKSCVMIKIERLILLHII